jgi:hypothetical protein
MAVGPGGGCDEDSRRATAVIVAKVWKDAPDWGPETSA